MSALSKLQYVLACCGRVDRHAACSSTSQNLMCQVCSPTHGEQHKGSSAWQTLPGSPLIFPCQASPLSRERKQIISRCVLCHLHGCRWYSQAGTPTLTVSTSYDAAKKTYTINTQQKTPPTSGQPDKAPVLIPLKVWLEPMLQNYGHTNVQLCVHGCWRSIGFFLWHVYQTMLHAGLRIELDLASEWVCVYCSGWSAGS